jgi:thiamine pyrophosphate-dependent acetolactate synthase large subunit-like protein
LFKIVSESAISAGVRRIEAVTGEAAETLVYAAQDIITSVEQTVRSPKIVQAIEKMVENNAALGREIEEMRKEKVASLAEHIATTTQPKDGIMLISRLTKFQSEVMKDLAFALRQKVDSKLVMVVGNLFDGKPTINVMLSDDVVAQGVDAGATVREAAKLINGGGGGQKHYATAGGKNAEGLQAAVDKAVELIKASKKPYIYVGGGIIAADAAEEFRTFAAKVDAPVCDSLMGKGAIDGNDPKYTGMIGMHGTKTSNFGVSECDLLIAVGARFSDRVTGNASKFAKNAKIIHIDVDAAEINKNIRTDASVIGDAKEVLARINAKLDNQEHGEWLAHIKEYAAKYPLTYNKEALTGPFVIEKIYEVTNGDAIITTEVGQHQMWAAQFYKYNEPRKLITSGGLGTMGYGLGASLGAKMAKPDKTVINIAGDGCFRMNMNEIATAVRYNIPIIQVVINNHVLGMVRQWQTLFYGKRYSNTILNDSVNFKLLAEAMGAKGYTVTNKDELESVLKEAIACGGPVVIDCQIHEDDKVFPMVAPGAPISEAFSAEDLES